jgi:hypothetical protein
MCEKEQKEQKECFSLEIYIVKYLFFLQNEQKELKEMHFSKHAKGTNRKKIIGVIDNT